MFTLIFKTIFVVCGSVFGIVLGKDILKNGVNHDTGNAYTSGAIGFVVNFFDALGIGSFAVSTVLLRWFRQIPDKLLPGTLNVMCILPQLTEAFIYIGIIETDYFTLVCMATAAIFGGWLGARFVTRLPESQIRFAMAIALTIAATVMLAKQLHLLPIADGATLGLSGLKLVFAIFCSILIGAVGNIGIGSYAPFLSLACLLGMSAKSIFPIMMTAGTLSCYASSFVFIKHEAYSRKVALAMGLCGCIGVFFAAFIVKSLPIEKLLWLVMGVVYYASITLFIASRKKPDIAAPALNQ